MNKLYDIMYRYPAGLKFSCIQDLDVIDKALDIKATRINATASVNKEGQAELVLSYDDDTFVCIVFDVNQPNEWLLKHNKVFGFISRVFIGEINKYMFHQDHSRDSVFVCKYPDKYKISVIYPQTDTPELIICDFKQCFLLLRDKLYSRLVVFKVGDNGKINESVATIKIPPRHNLIYTKLCGKDYSNSLQPFVLMLYEETGIPKYKVCSIGTQYTFTFGCPLKTNLFTLDDDNHLIYLDESDPICFCMVQKLGIPNASPKSHFEKRSFVKPKTLLPGKILDISVGPFRNVIQITTINQFLIDTLHKCEPNYDSDDEL